MSYIYLPCNLYNAWNFVQSLANLDRLWDVALAQYLQDDWAALNEVPHYSEENCQTLEGLTELHGLRISTDCEHLRLPVSLKKLRYTKKR